MKQITLVIGLCTLMLWSKALAFGGEFRVLQTTGYNKLLTIHVQSMGPCWKLDSHTDNVIVVASYDTTFQDTHFLFDSPDNADSSPNGVMPWGVINIDLRSDSNWINFTIDFRDQNWATGYGSSQDMTLFFNPKGGLPFLVSPSHDTTIVSPGDSVTIWSAYGRSGGVLRSHFLSPLFLQNIIAGTNSGGFLSINGAAYSSGNAASVAYNQSYTIATKALNDGTNIDRFPNYKSLGITYKHNNWVQLASDKLLQRSVYLTTQNIQQFAYYFPLNSLTLQTNLDGTVYTGSNGGYVSFVDPWYVADASGSQPGTAVNITSGNSPTGAYNQSSGGVFLNQSGPANSWNPPVYSLQAPATQTINGHSGYFGGWSVSPSGAATFENASSATTKVVFNSAGAVIAANYLYSVVSTNMTLPAGTYTFAGNVTVNSGATLTLSSGTTLKFPSGAGLTVNGRLVASGTTFTGVSNATWSGVTFNSANGSSLSNVTISYASSPIVINSTSSITLNSVLINNSNFGSNAALRAYYSSPTISYLTINGQSGSWNGVRFASYSSGSLNWSSIQSCGAGNGVVVEGGSSPLIFDNTISNNHYHGIIVINNGSGNPILEGNVLNANGMVGTTKVYNGIEVNNSHATIEANTIRYSNFGVRSELSGLAEAYGLNGYGANVITNNGYGLEAYSSATVWFGGDDYNYAGTCNSIYANDVYDAIAASNGYLMAKYNWWGAYPPNSSKITHDGNSTVDYSSYERREGDCPTGITPLVISDSSKGNAPVISALLTAAPTPADTNITDIMNNAEQSISKRDFEKAKYFLGRVLRNASDKKEQESAAAMLHAVLRKTNDTTLIGSFVQYKKRNESSILANELLASSNLALDRLDDAFALYSDMTSQFAGSETGKYALTALASLSSFDEKYSKISDNALSTLLQKYGQSVDGGVVAALVRGNESANQKAGNGNSENMATATAEFSIDNFPNPFNPTTTIEYTLPQADNVTLKVYDIVGREIATLVSGYATEGKHSVTFDASRLSSGMYFYKFQAGKTNIIKKMLLLK
jgi:parallel beta-helix repeat protein